MPLDVARARPPKQVAIPLRLDNGADKAAERLQELFTRKPGETDVRLRLLRSKDFLAFYDLGAHVRADREFQAEVERICGAGSLEVVPA